MLLRTIENIRHKPKAVRQRYALVVTVIFTALVTGLWTLSLPTRFVAVQEEVGAVAPAGVSQTAAAPFSGVWSQLKQQLSGMVGSEMSTTTNAITIDMTATTTLPTQSVETDTSTIHLESGSTITFGATASAEDAPGIMLGTNGSTSSTSPVVE